MSRPFVNSSAAIEPSAQRRQRWIGILARLSRDTLEAAWQDLSDRPRYGFLRRPEAGLVMTRARAGGTGQPFNLGEATVARCVVQLADGPVGVGYVMGRDLRRAELAAVFDALLQRPDRTAEIERSLIGPAEREQRRRREVEAAKAGATKVDFFTVVRGED